MTPQYAVSDINFVAPHFPQYSFQKLIAQGKLGAVYKAVQTNLDRDIAFRVIARRIGREDAVQQAFQVQARAAAKLSHPNIAKVYDFGDMEEMLYMVQEYIPGYTLDIASGGVKVAVDQALEVIIGLCTGLVHAHEHGVIHGDLQPKSVFITHAIETKVIDFGLAMTMRQMGRSDIAHINPSFTAPEVVQGKTYGDKLTDIYSVGAIFYHLLTASTIDAPGAMVASAVAAVDERFDEIIGKAISSKIEKRYQSMAEMLADLKTLKQSLEEPTPPSPPATKPLNTTTSVVRTPKFHFPKAG